MEVSALLLNPWILLALIVALSTILFIVSLFESKITSRKSDGKEYIEERDKEIFFILEGKNMPPEDKLEAVNHSARVFFDELFYFDASLEYAQIKNEFKILNNPSGMRFCDKMTQLLYTGKKAEQRDINELILLLKQIISAEKEKERKKELSKPIPALEYGISNLFNNLVKVLSSAMSSAGASFIILKNKMTAPKMKVKEPKNKVMKLDLKASVQKVSIKSPTKSFNFPKIKMPTIKMPSLSLPKFNFNFPKIKIPMIKIPHFSMPKMNLKMPTINMPKFSVPKLNFNKDKPINKPTNKPVIIQKTSPKIIPKINLDVPKPWRFPKSVEIGESNNKLPQISFMRRIFSKEKKSETKSAPKENKQMIVIESHKPFHNHKITMNRGRIIERLAQHRKIVKF